MKRTIVLSLVALICFAGSVQAEIVKSKDTIVFDRKEVGGGKGILYGKYAFKRDQPPASCAIRELCILTLEPGDSIGYHKHETNEDSYTIISGTGTYKDANGKDYEVGPGDMTVVRAGESHGLTNTGKVPLVFVAVIAQK